MASFSLHAEDRFPESTTVSALPQSNYAVNQRPPTANVGAVTATATVTNGVATFTGLADDMAYYATATVSGQFRVISFRTPVAPATTGWSALSDEARNRGWLPSGAIVSNILWADAINEGIGSTSGTLKLTGGLILPAGRQISSVTFVSGSTAAVTPTNQWAALYDRSTLALLATSADDLTNAWASRTPKTFTFSTPYTPSTELEVYAGLLIAAATAPNMTGANLVAGISGTTGVMPFKAATSTTGLTGLPAPNPAGALTAAVGQPFCYVS